MSEDNLSVLIWGPAGKPQAPKRGVPVRVIEVRDVPIRIVEMKGSSRSWTCKRVGPMPGSKKDLDGEDHIVRVDGLGGVVCDCTGFGFKQSCRHVEAVRIFTEEATQGNIGPSPSDAQPRLVAGERTGAATD